MTLAVLQPAANPDARRHYADTVQKPVRLGGFRNVPDSIRQRYARTGEARLWGVTPGQAERSVKAFQRLSPGDLVLFTGNGGAFAVGRIGVLVRDAAFAHELWGEDKRGQTWELIFSVEDLLDVDLPYLQLNRMLGYSEKAVVQGFTVLSEPLSQRLLDLAPIRRVVAPDSASQTLELPSGRYTVPLVAPDVFDAPDALDRSADAQAIGALIASRQLSPPLAVGLFGPWGSGKTHFMGQVASSVAACTDGSEPAFCSNIRQIWFNAWHYAEHNLWASLLEHVWSSLEPGNSSSSSSKTMLDDALAKVEGAKRIRQDAEEAATKAAENRHLAEEALAHARQDHEALVAQAAGLSSADLLHALAGELGTSTDPVVADARQRLQAAVDSVGLSADLSTAEGLTDALDEVRSAKSRLFSLNITKPWYRAPLVVGLAVALAVGLVGLLCGVALEASEGTWVATAVTAISQVGALLIGGAAWLVRRAAVARRLLAPAQRLRQTLDERLAQTKARQDLERAKLDEQLAAADVALQRALARLEEADREHATAEADLKDLTGGRLLQRYLTERATAREYDEYLGLVGLAHRDLKALASHLEQASRDESVDSIDRIVLYIDDLDRCSPTTVARVLEAVHLLLALPLFVAVVGVDRRWLDRSLTQVHTALLDARAPVGETSTRDYLDKIFHLTFTLPELTHAGAARLLLQSLPEPRQQDDGLPQADSNESPASEDSSEAVPAPSTQEAQDQGAALPRVAQSLQLDDSDREILGRVAPLISSSPRRVLRFLSTYLVVRARASVSPSQPADVATTAPEDQRALACVIALLFGVPGTAQALMGLGDDAQAHALQPWLLQAVAQAPPDEQERVRTFLREPGERGHLSTSGLTAWLPLVTPYTRFAYDEALATANTSTGPSPALQQPVDLTQFDQQAQRR